MTKHTLIDKNSVYYLLLAVIFIVFKFSFRLADNDAVLFLTQATDKIVSIVSNSKSVYDNQNGFLHKDLNIVINKSCSGFNFWTLCFVMFIFVSLKKLKTHFQKIILFFLAIILAYLLTIFVNSSRILVSLFVHNTLKIQYDWLHQVEGIFIYLSFLIVFYHLFNFGLKTFLSNAKST